jgi:hypothetical protein
VFCNLPKGAGRVEPDNDLLVVDAAMRTSAAPTFFPVYQGTNAPNSLLHSLQLNIESEALIAFCIPFIAFYKLCIIVYDFHEITPQIT